MKKFSICGFLLGTLINVAFCEKITDPFLLKFEYDTKQKSSSKFDLDEFIQEDTLAGWSKWTEWSECSKRCSGGRRMRYRTCRTNLKAAFSKYLTGAITFHQYLKRTPSCIGQALEYLPCNIHACGLAWSQWETWTACSKSCGFGGQQARLRTCKLESTNLELPNGEIQKGKLAIELFLKTYSKCAGNGLESRKCSVKICPATRVVAKKVDLVEKLKPRSESFEISKAGTFDWVDFMMIQTLSNDINFDLSAVVELKLSDEDVEWSAHLLNADSVQFAKAQSSLMGRISVDEDFLAVLIDFSQTEEDNDNTARVLIRASEEDLKWRQAEVENNFNIKLRESLEAKNFNVGEITVESATSTLNFCTFFSDSKNAEPLCENGGSCFTRAKGMICRCPIEFYGAKCQHQRFAVPPKPEFLTIVANFNEIVIKWLPIFEDSSSNTVIERLTISVGSESYTISDLKTKELKKSIEPNKEVQIKIYVVYKNGIITESENYAIRSAPKLETPKILERFAQLVKLKFGEESPVERYTVMRTNKKKKGKDRYSQPIYEGRSTELEVVPQVGFPSGRDVTFAIQGQTEFGLTDIKEISIRIKHAAPLFLEDKIKVGITKIELFWKQIQRARGYRLEIFKNEYRIKTFNLDSEISQKEIFGLKSNTKYQARIIATSPKDQGNSPWASYNFKTAPIRDTRPHLDCSPVKVFSTFLSIDCGADFNASQPLSAFVENSLVGDEYSAQEFLVEDLEIHGLEPYNSYKIALKTEKFQVKPFLVSTAPFLDKIDVIINGDYIDYEWQGHYGKLGKFEVTLGTADPFVIERNFFRREKLKAGIEYLLRIREIFEKGTIYELSSDYKDVVSTTPFALDFIVEENKEGGIMIVWDASQSVFSNLVISSKPPMKKQLIADFSSNMLDIAEDFYFPDVNYELSIQAQSADSTIRSKSFSTSLTTKSRLPIVIDRKVGTDKITILVQHVPDELSVKNARSNEIIKSKTGLVTLEDLIPDTKYQFQLFTRNSFVTYESISKLPELKLSVLQVGTNNASVEFQSVGNGWKATYQVLCSINSEEKVFKEKSVILENLEQGRNYKLQCSLANDDSGEKSATVITNFRTEPGPPAFNLLSTEESLTVIWRADGNVEAIAVEITRADNPSYSRSMISTSSPETITGLDPDIVYTVRVLSYQDILMSYFIDTKYSEEKTVQTKAPLFYGEKSSSNNDEFVIKRNIKNDLVRYFNPDHVKEINIISVIKDGYKYVAFYDISFSILVDEYHRGVLGMELIPQLESPDQVESELALQFLSNGRFSRLSASV